MSDWQLCAYAVSVVSLSMAVAGAAGYWLGCQREQRALLELLRLEK